MGKKSRKVNNKRADGSPKKSKALVRNILLTIEDHYVRREWKAVVELAEPHKDEVLRLLNASPMFDYSISGFYFQTAVAYMKFGDSKNAIEFFEKTVQTTKKRAQTVMDTIGRDDLCKKSEKCLVDCYLSEGRCHDAAPLVKRALPCTHLSNPQLLQEILDFFAYLMSLGENELGLEMAECYLNEHRQQNPKEKAEGPNLVEFNMLKTMARCQHDLNNYDQAIATLHQVYECCPYEMNIAYKEADILSNLGRSYGIKGDPEKSEYYMKRVNQMVLDHQLDKMFEWHKEIVMNMAEIHFHLENHELDAIDFYQRVLVLIRKKYPKATDDKLAYIGSEHLSGKVYRNIGTALLRLKSYEEAIEALDRSISLLTRSQVPKYRDAELFKSYQEQGRAYLERFCWDEGLSSPKERRKNLDLSLEFSSKALNLIDQEESGDRNLYLDMAQEHYLLNDAQKSHEFLKKFLDFAVKAGPLYCQFCHQTSPKEDMMQVCKGCKVASYCGCAHQTLAWKRERTGHRKICGMLKTWRSVRKGKVCADSCLGSFDKYFAKTFKSAICSSEQTCKPASASKRKEDANKCTVAASQ